MSRMSRIICNISYYNKTYYTCKTVLNDAIISVIKNTCGILVKINNIL